MEESVLSAACSQFLQKIKEKGKKHPEFRENVATVQEAALSKGLEDRVLKKAIKTLINSDLKANDSIALIKCLIPRDKISDEEVKVLIIWFLSIPSSVTTLNTLVQWFIGCWEYQLINRDAMYIFYDSLFYVMLKQESLESRLAQLIYLMTKPEDVTRRQVTRLLSLSKYHRKPKKHIIALLSLFKSYKPEYVPEKIETINIQSTWRPIPEVLSSGFAEARDRIITQKVKDGEDFGCDWSRFNIPKAKKNQEPLLPSVGYFNIGSSILKNKNEKLIFDVSSMSQIGKYHSLLKLPCNATSMLTNSIGYHLLIYTDLEYQQRFMHNLYYTLWKSFIFENGRYSCEEMDSLLNMTLDFFNYMQNGITIVDYFINEYLCSYIDNHQIQIFNLMQWSSASSPELEDYVLKHLKLVFYSSSVDIKCKIIRTVKRLLLNLSIVHDTSFENTPFPFLMQSNTNQLKDKIKVLDSFSKSLIISGLNIHCFDSAFISESLSFYEQYGVIRNLKQTYVALAPPAVVYGSFVNRSCAILSRICALLLEYRKYFKEHKDARNSIKWLIIYAEDLVSALWYDNCFNNRNAVNRYFLQELSEKAVKSTPTCDINCLLNICHHYAVLPYLFTLSTSGLQIRTKKDASSVAAHYYIHIHQLIFALLGN
ncbi:hypothetical protein TKK_0001754 [Trichogramma kaykai]|uniref:Centromere protein I n=1 Tax=Trichogramma kaykai TaxID=54128 RepID=A0ABD2XEX7_9HYME